MNMNIQKKNIYLLIHGNHILNLELLMVYLYFVNKYFKFLSKILSLFIFIILDSQLSSSEKCDVYGLINNKQQISKGFITTESAIQFKLFDSPITFWTPKLKKMIVC